MKKFILVAGLLAMSTSVFARGIEETVAAVEAKKDAKCTYVKSSPGICFGDPVYGVCTNWEKFKCLPNTITEREFKLSLKVRRVGISPAVVKKITYTYK